MIKFFYASGALLGGLAVILGAWGAHGGEKIFTPEQIHTFQKAVRYQMHHALVLFAVSWALDKWPENSLWIIAAGTLLLAGVVLFSGSLYLLVFEVFDPGYLTPLGGAAMILGWLLLAISVIPG